MNETKKHRWIDDSIIIDFKLQKVIQNLIKEIEYLDEIGDDILYDDRCDTLENITKDSVLGGYMTMSQRDKLLRKYS